MRNLLGSNQYQAKRGIVHRVRRTAAKERHILDLTHGGDWDLIRFALIVLTAIIIGLVAKSVRDHWSKTTGMMIVTQAHAQVKDYTMPELASPQTQEQVKGLIRKIWGRDAAIGIAISRCESGYRPNAVNYNSNATIDEGIFQINSVHNMPDMQNPTANILYAYGVFREQGTTPWLSSAACWKGML